MTIAEWENDSLTPEQFFSLSRPTSCQRVALALLADVFVVQRLAVNHPTSRHWQKLVTADLGWLNGEPALISFETVCDALNVPPALVRRAYHARAATQGVA